MKVTTPLRSRNLFRNIFVIELILSSLFFLLHFFFKLQVINSIIFFNLIIIGLICPLFILFQEKLFRAFFLSGLVLFVIFVIQSEIFRINLDDPTGYGAIIFPGFVAIYSNTLAIIIIAMRKVVYFIKKYKSRNL